MLWHWGKPGTAPAPGKPRPRFQVSPRPPSCLPPSLRFRRAKGRGKCKHYGSRRGFVRNLARYARGDLATAAACSWNVL
jgi:hypothetical protein